MVESNGKFDWIYGGNVQEYLDEVDKVYKVKIPIATMTPEERYEADNNEEAVQEVFQSTIRCAQLFF